MKVTLIGVGMGNIDTLTIGAYKEIEKADCIIGATRILESLPKNVCQNRICEILPNKIIADIDLQAENSNICVLFSGDIGFYSGARKLLSALNNCEVKSICGVSSVQYFAAEIKKSWQAWKLVSAHGISCDVCNYVSNNAETFFLTGGEILAHNICQTLCDGGFYDCKITVGENLSYSSQKITTGTAKELADKKFLPLSVVLVENVNLNKRKFVTQGLNDESFLRGKSPMTKQEIRAVSLAKLKISPSDICYDIGAGTGSVTIEMGMLAREGHVFAVETEKDACELIRQNAVKFSLGNITIANTMAPDAMNDFPAPNVVFIGGSKGNLEAILSLVKSKNNDARVVINAITLETLSQAVAAMEKLNFCNVDIVQVAVSKAKKIGNYNMMMAQNPVFIISGGGSADE